MRGIKKYLKGGKWNVQTKTTKRVGKIEEGVVKILYGLSAMRLEE